jgi:hypothetical protein
MPVLAEKTVKTATPIEHGEVHVSFFNTRFVSILRIPGTRATRAKPPCDTVSGKRIIIPF